MYVIIRITRLYSKPLRKSNKPTRLLNSPTRPRVLYIHFLLYPRSRNDKSFLNIFLSHII